MILNDSGRTLKRAKRPGKKQQKNGKVCEAEVNEKIGGTARISRCRNKTNNNGIEVTGKQTQHKNIGN